VVPGCASAWACIRRTRPWSSGWAYSNALSISSGTPGSVTNGLRRDPLANNSWPSGSMMAATSVECSKSTSSCCSCRRASARATSRSSRSRTDSVTSVTTDRRAEEALHLRLILRQGQDEDGPLPQFLLGPPIGGHGSIVGGQEAHRRRVPDPGDLRRLPEDGLVGGVVGPSPLDRSGITARHRESDLRDIEHWPRNWGCPLECSPRDRQGQGSSGPCRHHPTG
jgi:hypothetical protein